MGNGNAKFLVGLGIDPAIGALICHFSHTAKVKKLKNDMFNALRKIGADAELVVVEAKGKVVKTGAKVARKMAGRTTEVKGKLTSNSQ